MVKSCESIITKLLDIKQDPGWRWLDGSRGDKISLHLVASSICLDAPRLSGISIAVEVGSKLKLNVANLFKKVILLILLGSCIKTSCVL